MVTVKLKFTATSGEFSKLHACLIHSLQLQMHNREINLIGLKYPAEVCYGPYYGIDGVFLQQGARHSLPLNGTLLGYFMLGHGMVSILGHIMLGHGMVSILNSPLLSKQSSDRHFREEST